MTKDEIQAMIDAAVTAARPQVYTSVEECPEWARETVQRAVDCGVLQGNQSGALHLTDDNLVNLQMLRNAGLLESGRYIWSISTDSRRPLPPWWAA